MTSGKAGGLKTCEPLKAVGNQSPPKGGDYLKMLSWSRRRSSRSWFWIYSRTVCSSLPTVDARREGGPYRH